MDYLHKFRKTHIDKDCSNLSGIHENELFFNCIFDNLNNLCLVGCELNQSKVITNDVFKALNCTVTLNCKSFKGVELSETVFNLLLLLLYMTKGNDTKRRKLFNIVGKEKAEKILDALSRIDT